MPGRPLGVLGPGMLASALPKGSASILSVVSADRLRIACARCGREGSYAVMKGIRHRGDHEPFTPSERCHRRP
jgi:hypothetical protein